MWCGRGAGPPNCPDRVILTLRVSPDGTMTRSGNRPDPNKSLRTGGRLDSRTPTLRLPPGTREVARATGKRKTLKQYAPTIAQDGPRCSRECNAPTLSTTTTTLAMSTRFVDYYRGWVITRDSRPGRALVSYRADMRGVTLSALTRPALHGMIDTRERNTTHRDLNTETR